MSDRREDVRRGWLAMIQSKGILPREQRAARLAAIYQDIEADGGGLSPEKAAAIVDEVRASSLWKPHQSLR